MNEHTNGDHEAAIPPGAPLHLAIIMDGNGRWAQQRGLPRIVGHRAGTRNVRRIISACIARGVRYLTLYAFSTENWGRPTYEVQALMRLLGEFIDRETQHLHHEGVQIRHLGRAEELPQHLQDRIRSATDLTKANTRITVAVALNYSGRSDIVDALRRIAGQQISPAEITEQFVSNYLSTRGMPDPDLIIRTSGERRLSNFLIWQAAYSEYWMTPILWPDFTPALLDEALRDYASRDRRFGGVADALTPCTE